MAILIVRPHQNKPWEFLDAQQNWTADMANAIRVRGPATALRYSLDNDAMCLDERHVVRYQYRASNLIERQ